MGRGSGVGVGGVFGLALWLGATVASGQPSVVGEWSPVQQWPISATHAHLLPTGKVLVFGEFEQGELPPLLWDPETDAITNAPRADYNIFCAGHSYLADGRLFVAGGHVESHVGVPYARIFDPWNMTWSKVPDMNDNRWYPTNTTLPNGDVLVTSGEMYTAGENNPLAQVFETRTGTWRDLTNAIFELPYYPRQFVAPNGRVFVASPSKPMRWLDTDGTGAWINAGGTNCCTRSYGNAMLRDGQLYLIGGGNPPTATVEMIDLNMPEPVARYVAPMSVPRRQQNSTFLPDGRILVTGGSSAEGFNEAAGSVEFAEVYDPETDTWTTWSSLTGYYGYHATAVLVPDGRVLVAGGRTKKHKQVFSPPYLFAGPRPTVSSAPSLIEPGTSFVVGSPESATIKKVSLIALASTTHALDMNTRFISLQFQQSGTNLTITAPANNNVAPPGPYQLFLVDQNGVPSVGRIVLVGLKPPATRKVLKYSDTWRYDDRGIDHGTAWIQPGFDDSGWLTGTGQFGYGDWDNATPLTRLSPTQPSYYFRKTFTLTSAPTSAEFELVHDDGVAVWVNGREVFSQGMDNGVQYAATASMSVNNRISRFAVDLSNSPFVVGENTIAVMVKQVSATSNDVSFALQLEVADNAIVTDAVSVLAPNGGEVLRVGETASVRWQTVGASRATVDLAWSSDDGGSWQTIASGIPNTGTYTWTVPDVPTTAARFRVSSAQPPAISDVSDGRFTLSRAETIVAVPRGSTWKYEDSGQDPGATWTSAGFDDSGWRSGSGQLGYGDGDEATVLTKTSPVQTSVYFRRHVQVDGSVRNAELEVLYDDGIAVWVNGTLALTRNMNAGLGHDLYASGSAENQVDVAAIPGTLFVPGHNVIAVMVKQTGSTSPDLSFDLKLTLEVEEAKERLLLTAPNGGEALTGGGTFEITWAGTTLGPRVDLAYADASSGGHGGMQWTTIATNVPNTGLYTWTVPRIETMHAMVRVSISGDLATQDISDAEFTIATGQQVRAINRGDTWRYEDSGQDPGASWALPSFDDSSWKSGAAQLGYGDGDEATVLTRTSPSQPSVYFRKTITVNGTVTWAQLHALYDDGVAVYVNGTPVLVQNMDRGTEHWRYASSSSENDEVMAELPLSPNPFVQGTNVIGVMVKQNGGTSPDLSFDLELDLRVEP